jgi:hypothetical protein
MRALMACLTGSVLLLATELLGVSDQARDSRHPAPLSSVANYELCVVMQAVAAVCGDAAIRRARRWWSATVMVATAFAIGCFFGEV